MMRGLIQRLSRERIVRRRLPRAFGGHRLYVSPDASLRYWRPGLGAADPLLLRLAAELVVSGARVWDVGANVGLFAFAAAFRAGPGGEVVAVEADDWLAGLLRRSARRMPPGYAPVAVVTAAVAEAPGIAELCIARRGRAASHLGDVAGSSQAGGTREVAHVAQAPLDALLTRFAPPQVVKIDVEGAEVRCLAGAERLLAEARPAIVCEVATANAAAAAAILVRHRYTIFDATAAPAARVPLAAAPWSTLALPRP